MALCRGAVKRAMPLRERLVNCASVEKKLKTAVLTTRARPTHRARLSVWALSISRQNSHLGAGVPGPGAAPWREPERIFRRTAARPLQHRKLAPAAALPGGSALRSV